MRRYLDTSLLVAALIREAGTPAAKTYLSACGDEPLLISRWVITEFSYALAIKVRTGIIRTGEQGAALKLNRRAVADIGNSCRWALDRRPPAGDTYPRHVPRTVLGTTLEKTVAVATSAVPVSTALIL
ncbi:type II toxin-antitoxin system VapC family toxin [uncultured Lamprocystis sp.]|jgi:predicted nucleic acid-binding protein|uniref:type II toxin-antitoxin system VapC family toxin n=1 Tax=uncultured Lamprocystis sp. TaxID=543132 RepID=UPI0025F4DB5D|nr:type II toxin-antitoxin system VapC family toxin [uncultured Lamprocystis sp.]